MLINCFTERERERERRRKRDKLKQIRRMLKREKAFQPERDVAM